MSLFSRICRQPKSVVTALAKVLLLMIIVLQRHLVMAMSKNLKCSYLKSIQITPILLFLIVLQPAHFFTSQQIT